MKSRPMNTIKGSGAYDMTSLKKAIQPLVKKALTSGGAYLGGATGVPGGALFGRELGSKLSRLIGSGDYETNVSVNDLIRPQGVRPSATFGEDLNLVRIRRREFIGDISTSAVAGAFVNYSFPINAGYRTTFPFLSQLADNYEEYCFDGLVFEFVSSASPYIANTALGTVVAAMEYNSSMPPFSTKYTMENSALAVSTRLDHNLMYGVECAKGSNVQNCYYVRSGASTLPLTTTDLGLFQLAIAPAAGVTASSVVGELWVTYDVVLSRPILNASRSAYYHANSINAVAASPFGVSLKSSSYGGAISVTLTSTVLTITNAVVGDVYSFYWLFAGGVGGVLVYPTLTLGGCAGFNGINQNTQSSITIPAAGVTSLSMSVFLTFVATSTTCTITLGAGGTFPTTATNMDVYVSMLGNPLTTTGF